MRRIFAMGAALLPCAALVLAMLAGSDANADRLRQRDQLGTPGWVLPGAAIDLNFAQGQYWGTKSGCRSAATCLNVTRASVGTAQDKAGNVISFASGRARVTNQGLLVEEARTNSQPYNEMAGAAFPNTFPTGWALSFAGGLTVTVEDTGTENGIPYVDINIAGTTSGASAVNLSFVTPVTTVAAANAQVWTSSVFWRLSGGSLANLSGANLYILMYNSGGSFLGQLFSSIGLPSASTLGLGRVSTTQTLNQSTTAYITHLLSIAWSAASLPINATFRIGGVQLEQGSYSTSLVFTNGAPVTRAADFITVADPPAFGGNAITVYVLATPQAPLTYPNTLTPLQIDEGDNNQRIDIDRNSSGYTGVDIFSGGTAWSSPGDGQWPQNMQWPIAWAFQTNDQAAVFNGTLETTNTAGMFVPSRIIIGADGVGVHQWDGTIARLAIWPTTRQPNSFLQQIAP